MSGLCLVLRICIVEMLYAGFRKLNKNRVGDTHNECQVQQRVNLPHLLCK